MLLYQKVSYSKFSIINKLRYDTKSTFSSLQKEDIESNKLAYHLQTLIEHEIISKEGEYYSLTTSGRALLNFLEDGSANIRKSPVPVIGLIPIKDGKVLLQERKKEPWYGYWLCVGGKIESGEKFEEAALRELKEETGLEGTPKLLGIASLRTYDNNKLQYHVHMYYYVVENIKGNLEKIHENGENKWFDPKDIKNIKIHPLDEIMVERRNDPFFFIEQEEYYNGKELVSMEVRKLV